jgi:hypothetical protein
MIKSDIRGETIENSSKISKINKVKTINIEIKVITKLPNFEQSYKGKVQTTVTVTAGTFEP